MDYNRRSFLKGLAGLTVAGSYVITNPKVVAGDLLVPSPEPTIIKASDPLVQVGGPVEAWVKNVSVFHSVHGVECEVVLSIDMTNHPDIASIWQAGKVRMYPVLERGK